MWRNILFAIGVYFAGLGVMMWGAPLLWYELTPGVAMMGPYNLHFVRDIALVFFMSGVGLAWGAMRWDRTGCVMGIAWPALHALFHLWIWGARGAPADLVALTNLLGIQLPVWLAVLAINRYFKQEAHQ